MFEHDIAYDKAVGLIGRMQKVAAQQGLVFGVKLSNTLAMHNHKQVMPGDEMYMSGRALYPVTMNLFDKLAHEFNGDLRVSYSAGADALNIATILSCGPVPITACSDLLKPGGYARFGQWLENLEAAMAAAGAANLAEFSANKLANVKQPRRQRLTDPRYKKEYVPYGLPKVKSRAGPVRLRRRAVHRTLRGLPGRAGVQLVDQRGRPRQGARSHPGRAIRCPASPATSATTCARPAASATTTKRPWPSAR